MLWRQATGLFWERMKRIFCHNLFFRILSILFVLFGFWGLYINLCDKEKNTVLIVLSGFFTLFIIILSLYVFKKIQIDENTIIYRNSFFQKRTIKIQKIEDIYFSRANAERYVEIKSENRIKKIEYSNKKIEKEIKEILQKVLTYKHNKE